MKKNKLLLTILSSTLILSLFAGCTAKTNNLTEDQKIEILNEIKIYDVAGEKTLSDLEKLIDENISNYNEEERDIMVNKYIEELYSNLGSLSDILLTVGYDLEDIVEKFNIDVNNKKDYSKIPDNNAIVRGFLEELHAKGFSLEKSSSTGSYIIVLDTVALKDKYSDKVSKSLSKFLEFNAYESTSKAFANSEARTVDLDEVAKRIAMIEDGIVEDKEQDYKYIDNWMSASNYYYQILIGTSHDYFVSTDYLKDDIFSKYKELAEKYKDKQLGKILNELVDIYTKNAKKADSNVLKEITDLVEKEVLTDEIQKALEEQYSSLSTMIENIDGTSEAETN